MDQQVLFRKGSAMKAKEYAQEWEAAGKSDEVLADIMFRMILEIQEIARMRRARSNDSMVSIIREVDKKWNAFARKFQGDVKPDAFRLVLLDQIPVTREIHHLVWPNKELPNQKQGV